MELLWSKEWVAVAEPSPVLSAGPDVRFELAGVSPETMRSLLQWQTSGGVGRTADAEAPSDEELELHSLLVGLGVLQPRIPPSPRISLISSRSHGELETALSSLGIETVPQEEAADLDLVLRTESEWPRARDRPHLGVDLTHHHTLVLGPLVVPGLTSCLFCLQRQTERQWGPDLAPPEPRVLRWANVLAELLTVQIHTASTASSSGSRPLVNATVAWDLQNGTVERERLFRAPDCGGPCRAPTGATIDLPWVAT